MVWLMRSINLDFIFALYLFDLFNMVVHVAAVQVKNSILNAPEIVCLPDAMMITVETELPFRGHFYVKGQYKNDNCHATFSETSNISKISYLVSYADCAITDSMDATTGGTIYSGTMLVQFHPWFVTKADRAFAFTCSYTDAVKEVENEFDVGMVATTELKGSLIMPTCQYTIHRGSVDGPPVQFAIVGEEVYHVWSCFAATSNGILVHSCNATDEGGNLIPLIDENGCTIDPVAMADIEYAANLTTASAEVHVFKFADQTHVKIRCQITVCAKSEGACDGITPPTCSDTPPTKIPIVASVDDDGQQTITSGSFVTPVNNMPPTIGPGFSPFPQGNPYGAPNAETMSPVVMSATAGSSTSAVATATTETLPTLPSFVDAVTSSEPPTPGLLGAKSENGATFPFLSLEYGSQDSTAMTLTKPEPTKVVSNLANVTAVHSLSGVTVVSTLVNAITKANRFVVNKTTPAVFPIGPAGSTVQHTKRDFHNYISLETNTANYGQTYGFAAIQAANQDTERYWRDFKELAAPFDFIANAVRGKKSRRSTENVQTMDISSPDLLVLSPNEPKPSEVCDAYSNYYQEGDSGQVKATQADSACLSMVLFLYIVCSITAFFIATLVVSLYFVRRHYRGYYQEKRHFET